MSVSVSVSVSVGASAVVSAGRAVSLVEVVSFFPLGYCFQSVVIVLALDFRLGFRVAFNTSPTERPSLAHLVAAELLSNVEFTLRARPNDLESLDLGDLCGPLAGSSRDAVDQHPVSLLDKASGGALDQVVRRVRLDDAGGRNVEGDIGRDGKYLGGRN